MNSICKSCLIVCNNYSWPSCLYTSVEVYNQLFDCPFVVKRCLISKKHYCNIEVLMVIVNPYIDLVLDLYRNRRTY